MTATLTETDFEVERRAAVEIYAEAEADFMSTLDRDAAVRLLAAKDELEWQLNPLEDAALGVAPYSVVLAVLDEHDERVLDIGGLERRVERSLALAEMTVSGGAR